SGRVTGEAVPVKRHESDGAAAELRRQGRVVRLRQYDRAGDADNDIPRPLATRSGTVVRVQDNLATEPSIGIDRNAAPSRERAANDDGSVHPPEDRQDPCGRTRR